ncbi:MAG TPA: hypothetical protein VH419_17560 [Nocardioidaceae bacterium]|jgi:hypothetical protein
MGKPAEPPMSGSTFVLLTLLIVLAGYLLVRWILGTIALVFNTAVLIAVLAGAVYLYVRFRESRSNR